MLGSFDNAFVGIDKADVERIEVHMRMTPALQKKAKLSAA